MLAAALGVLIKTTGELSLSNNDIINFIISLPGVAALLLAGTASIFLVYTNQAGMMIIGAGAGRNHLVSVLSVLHMMPAKLPKLLAGLILSAFGFTTTPLLKTASDVGVTLLLFTIGLKLKIKNLIKPEVWAGGTLHIGLTVAVLGFAIFCLGYSGLHFFMEMDVPMALLLDFALSFSSTVFACCRP